MSSNLPIDTLGSHVKAHLAAGDKAKEKAEQHYKAAGIHLLEAKKQIEEGGEKITWTAFIAGHCGLGRSRAYELLAIADGRTTVSEARAKSNARSKRAHAKVRELARAASDAQRTTTSTPSDTVTKPAAAPPEARHTALLNSIVERLSTATLEELNWVLKSLDIA